MRQALVRGVLVLTGLLVVHTPTSLSQQYEAPTYQDDPRLFILKSFFESRSSPLTRFAEDFLLAADRNHLDWRLLPSIAVVESGAGREFRNNNLFGWDNGNYAFASLREGIHLVAARLRHSKLYKNKTLDEKLSTYNPNACYTPLVKAVMAQIKPSESPPPEIRD